MSDLNDAEQRLIEAKAAVASYFSERPDDSQRRLLLTLGMLIDDVLDLLRAIRTGQ